MVLGTIYSFHSFSDTENEDLDLASVDVCYSSITTRSKRKKISGTTKKVCTGTTNTADIVIKNSSSRKRGPCSSKRK